MNWLLVYVLNYAPYLSRYVFDMFYSLLVWLLVFAIDLCVFDSWLVSSVYYILVHSLICWVSE